MSAEKRRRIKIETCCVFISLLCTFSSVLSCEAATWLEEKGEHFIVYYVKAGSLPKEVLRKAESCYTKVANNLGYARYDNFWQWDKRVKIYIHPNKKDFMSATGQPEWSHGMASYFEKEIHTIEGTKNFIDAVLPHEITHLIFRDFVGFKGQVPLWLDEGVAQWQEDAKREDAIKVMPAVLKAGEALPIKTFMRLDIRNETNGRKVAIFYTQSISVIDFMMKSYGAGSFTNFCRELRDGKSMPDALKSAYPGTIKNYDELEARWVKYIITNEIPGIVLQE